MATPTIAQVLTGHKDGTYTLEQAQALIGEHIATQAQRDAFAGLAMQTLLGDAMFMRKVVKDDDYPEGVALEAYKVAAAMMNART